MSGMPPVHKRLHIHLDTTVPMVIRRENSRRYVSWLQYLAIVGRRVVETVGGVLHAMFPRRIHAVTQEGFVIKVLTFVLVHNLSLMAQKCLGLGYNRCVGRNAVLHDSRGGKL